MYIKEIVTLTAYLVIIIVEFLFPPEIMIYLSLIIIIIILCVCVARNPSYHIQVSLKMTIKALQLSLLLNFPCINTHNFFFYL